MSRISHSLLCALSLSGLMLVASSCSVLAPRSSAPVVTAGKNSDTGLSAKLRENMGVRPAVAVPTPTVAPATLPQSVLAAATNIPSASLIAPYKMRPGDTIIIMLRDLPDARGRDPQIEDVIDDEGMVNLPHIGRLSAAGKTTSAFEQEIERTYVERKIYRRLTANVVVPQRIVFVTGEVKLSNKYPLVAGMTLSQAVATAGGWGEFADPKKTQLIRGGKTTLHNLLEIQKDPSKDIPLEAGDQIVVPRSWL